MGFGEVSDKVSKSTLYDKLLEAARKGQIDSAQRMYNRIMDQYNWYMDWSTSKHTKTVLENLESDEEFKVYLDTLTGV